MSGKPTKGVANVTRQTWDRAHYEKLAQLRASGQLVEEKVIKSAREEFKAADDGAAGPVGSSRAFLKARAERVTLDENVGSMTLKDSVAYLDHINGKRHLTKLGYSMRVERSSVDQVKSRLQSLAKRKYDPVITKKLDVMEEYEKKRRELEEEEARRKRQKKEAQKQKNKSHESDATADNATSTKPQDTDNTTATAAAAAGTAPVEASSSAANGDGGEDEDAMMAMMGFSGFGGSKKS
ncbi:hypothetical protein PINS_up011343 [Pythium insidiosum]|nr:hypothetical protein PINS_up011343 [Pythium insidiosum]